MWGGDSMYQVVARGAATYIKSNKLLHEPIENFQMRYIVHQIKGTQYTNALPLKYHWIDSSVDDDVAAAWCMDSCLNQCCGKACKWSIHEFKYNVLMMMKSQKSIINQLLLWLGGKINYHDVTKFTSNYLLPVFYRLLCYSQQHTKSTMYGSSCKNSLLIFTQYHFLKCEMCVKSMSNIPVNLYLS